MRPISSSRRPTRWQARWISAPIWWVLRTLSKAFALAGARCGFTLANEAVIALLEKIIAPYPVPVPVARLALDALSPAGLAQMTAQVAELNARRDQLVVQLELLPFVTRVLPSQANFVLFELCHARHSYEVLAQQGLFVRAYSDTRLRNWLRISIGSAGEVEQVMAALQDLQERLDREERTP